MSPRFVAFIYESICNVTPIGRPVVSVLGVNEGKRTSHSLLIIHLGYGMYGTGRSRESRVLQAIVTDTRIWSILLLLPYRYNRGCNNIVPPYSKCADSLNNLCKDE